MHLHKVEIRFVNKMLCNSWPDRRFIFINPTTLCSHRKVVPSAVTLPLLVFVQSKLLFQGCWGNLCRFTGTESTENILVMMNLLQRILHILDRGFSMGLELCRKIIIQKVLDAPQGFCEGNPLPCRRVTKSRRENWKNHSPQCFHLRTTPLRHLAVWLVEYSEARIWRHHRPERVKFVTHGMLFEEGCYPVGQMMKYIETHGMKHIK